MTAAALLGGFVAGWDAASMFLVFPDIRDGMGGGDETTASWVLSITSIVAAAVVLQAGPLLTIMPASMSLVSVRAGRLADRYGHRAVMLPSLVVYVVAYTVFVAVADAQRRFELLVPALVASGIAMGGVWPSLTSAIVRPAANVVRAGAGQAVRP